MLWRNLVQKHNVELWLQLLVNLFGLKQLFKKTQFAKVTQMTLICNNQVALHISSNPFFYERIKHIEIDFHFICEKMVSKDIKIEFVNSNDQLYY